MLPTISMSNMTSPSALAAVLGELSPPSTETASTWGPDACTEVKYALRSSVRYPPPSSISATHSPFPVVPAGKS